MVNFIPKTKELIYIWKEEKFPNLKKFLQNHLLVMMRHSIGHRKEKEKEILLQLLILSKRLMVGLSPPLHTNKEQKIYILFKANNSTQGPTVVKSREKVHRT